MKRRSVLTVAALVAALGLAAAGGAVGTPAAHVAPLSGAEEVPVNDSKARGIGVVKLSADGESLAYRLNVANIQNVTQAHIHQAPPGVNGPIVAWLYPPAPPAQLIPGRSSGTLQTGTITSADLVGPLAGQSLDALVAAIRSGNTYVNVHTSQFPPGEIRGQLSQGPPVPHHH
ncbi:MAG TPA: CHRD domain-containing protein [Jiangellales bacterium]|nr:CHRD domain-containing protein [Jiangellales bacterium]